MITESAMEAGAADVAKLNGVPSPLAAEYVSAIGDTPELAEDGRVIVRDRSGREVARVLWPESTVSEPGVPALPLGIPAEQLPFVEMRAVPGEPGIETAVEFYDTRTGARIPDDDE